MQRVLIVEQSPTLRHVLSRLLHGKGYPVAAANSLESAILKIQQDEAAGHKYDACVLGWPPAGGSANEARLMDLFGRPEHRGRAIILAGQEFSTQVEVWARSRPRTGLVVWGQHDGISALMADLLKEPSASSISYAPAAGIDDRAIRILLVDDSASVRNLYRRMLISRGYYTETAGSVDEGFDKASGGNFDLAIVDYFMPGKTGNVLCRRLRDDPRTTRMLSAILTSTYLEQVIKDALEAGAVECMFKDEAEELFLARVAAMSRSIQIQKSIDAERQRLESILGSVGDGVYGVGKDGVITFMNPAARHILGYDDADPVVGSSAHGSFHHSTQDGDPVASDVCYLQQAYATGDELRAWETVFIRKNGTPIPVECTVYPLQINKRQEGSVVAFRDISERKSLEELRWQATHDPLTELYNRRYFEEQLESEITRVRRTGEFGAVLYIDLDRFKFINDTAGHTAGDHLLVDTGRRLRTRLRDADLLARLSGDEFAVILRNIDPDNLYYVANSFREALSQNSFSYGGRQFKVNASVGATVVGRSTQSLEEALENANVACHLAKRKGRNQTYVYAEDSAGKLDKDKLETGWSTRLREALRDNNFVLYFQPIVPVTELEVDRVADPQKTLWGQLDRKKFKAHFYEVLVRLSGPEGEIIPPHVFIPTAERFDLMKEIDLWVVTNALKALAKANADPKEEPTIFSINLSSYTLEDTTLQQMIQELLTNLRLDGSRVVFEVTETSAITNVDAAQRFMTELKRLGCKFALDDFGTGFSSFSYLKHLPVDYIKIDGQFVQDMARDPINCTMVYSMNDVAHSLGLKTVAEYVESAEIIGLLKQCGVDFAQGNYVARPMSGETVGLGSGQFQAPQLEPASGRFRMYRQRRG